MEAPDRKREEELREEESKEEHEKAFRKALQEFMRDHSELLRRLAD